VRIETVAKGNDHGDNWRKKARLNKAVSEFPILKKENGSFDCYFKTAAWPHFGHKTSYA